MATTTTNALPTASGAGFNLTSNANTAANIGRDAIIWLSLLAAAAVLGVVIALYFLLRYICTKASRKRGQHVEDQRNEHKQWWKHADPPLEKNGRVDDDVEFAMLTRDVDGPGLGGFGATHEGQSGGMKSRYYSQPDAKVERVVL